MNELERLLSVWICLTKGISPVNPDDGSHDFWLFYQEARMIIRDAYKYREWMGKQGKSKTVSRIDIIGQNGNTGEHYE